MKHEHDPTCITPADEAAIDAWVESGYQPRNVDASQRPRVARVTGLLSLLDHLPEARTGDLLAQRTLQRVEEARRKERLSQHVDTLAQAPLPGLPLRELLALAAVVLVSLSVLWPMLASARTTARQISCQQSLAGAGLGFSSYANDNSGALPAVRMRLGDPWWLPGKMREDGSVQSNSAHLFHLAKSGHTPLRNLTCAENAHAPRSVTSAQMATMHDWRDHDALSFSYQNQYTERPVKFDRGPVIPIVADKNPFFSRGRYAFDLGRDQESRDAAVSHNHAAKSGQNALLTHGGVQWLNSARLDNDNIFHAGSAGLDNYTGLESPRDIRDAFLVE